MKKLFFLICISLSLAPGLLHAATLYFDTEESNAGLSEPFVVELLVDAPLPINAISVLMHLPEGIEAVDTSDGNSIVNYWIERPRYDELTRTLSFSGIVPGGFTGERARLILLTLKAKSPGVYVFDYDRQKTTLRRNDVAATADTISFVPQTIEIVRGKIRPTNNIPDVDLPEAFTPLVTRLTARGAYMIVFDTQDKQSGLQGFEISESDKKTEEYASLVWEHAESPYVLRDQSLKSFVYVKATDKKGNARIEVVEPERGHEWYRSARGLILILVVLGLLVLFRRSKRHAL